MGSSLQNAPFPLLALYILSSKQLYTTPNSNYKRKEFMKVSHQKLSMKCISIQLFFKHTCLLTAKAMETATNGNLKVNSTI